MPCTKHLSEAAKSKRVQQERRAPHRCPQQEQALQRNSFATSGAPPSPALQTWTSTTAGLDNVDGNSGR